MFGVQTASIVSRVIEYALSAIKEGCMSKMTTSELGWCPLCKRVVVRTKKFPIGAFIILIFTGIGWLIVLIAWAAKYPERCSICFYKPLNKVTPEFVEKSTEELVLEQPVTMNKPFDA